MPIRDLTEHEQSRLLTQAEVDDTPTGEILLVKWSGGNGPHPHMVWRHNGEAYTMDFCGGTARLGDRIAPVGKDNWNVRVFRFE